MKRTATPPNIKAEERPRAMTNFVWGLTTGPAPVMHRGSYLVDAPPRIDDPSEVLGLSALQDQEETDSPARSTTARHFFLAKPGTSSTPLHSRSRGRRRQTIDPEDSPRGRSPRRPKTTACGSSRPRFTRSPTGRPEPWRSSKPALFPSSAFSQKDPPRNQFVPSCSESPVRRTDGSTSSNVGSAVLPCGLDKPAASSSESLLS